MNFRNASTSRYEPISLANASSVPLLISLVKSMRRSFYSSVGVFLGL